MKIIYSILRKGQVDSWPSTTLSSHKGFIVGMLSFSLIAFSSLKAISQNNSLSDANTRPDLHGFSMQSFSRIIEQCIDIPALQKYYELNSNKGLEQLNIVQYPVSIPVD